VEAVPGGDVEPREEVGERLPATPDDALVRDRYLSKAYLYVSLTLATSQMP
jgi:hypothetical protein